MRGRSSRTATARWGRALVWSGLVHGFALIALVVQVGRRDHIAAADEVRLLPDAPIDPTFIDLAAELVVPTTSSATPQPPHEPDLSGLTPADEDRAPDRETAPRDALGRELVPPSPDRGRDRGRPLDDVAWRHDQSTLRERVTNAARNYQPPRIDTNRRSSSPQALRREPRTGTSDSPRTELERRPSRAVTFAQHAPEESAVALPSTNANAEGVANPKISGADATPRATSRTAGPLSVEIGPRSVDVEVPGRFADNRLSRLASSEHHPGITDLTRPSAVGTSTAGEGTGLRSGATPVATTGTAALLYGARDAQTRAAEVQEASRRAHHSRYVQEIQRRIRDRLIWPKVLALRLEQGETIVKFAVETNGDLTPQVRIVKSSGFQEFDDAALDAIRRASPFPPLPAPLSPGPLGFSMRFPFENPLIR